MSLSETALCKKCGTAFPAEGKFCPACGARKRRVPRYLVLVGALLGVVIFVLLARQGMRDPVAESRGSKSQGSQSVNEHLVRLRAEAESGRPAAVMALVETLMSHAEDAGMLGEAIARLDRLTEDYPNYDYALRLNANLLRQTFKHRRAVQAFRNYLARQPDDANARVALSMELLELDLADEAIVELEKVVAAFPDYALPYELLAQAYKAKQVPEEVLVYQAKAAATEARFGKAKPPLKFHPKLIGSNDP